MKNKILILGFLIVHLSSYGQNKKELIQIYDKLNVAFKDYSFNIRDI